MPARFPPGSPCPPSNRLHDLGIETISGGLAVAAIILVQGAGVAESVPNPDGSRTDTSHDFTSQGAANVAAGIFQGQPVGGSLSQTVLNVSAGALSRWGAISSGIGMVLILSLFSDLVGEVALATLAAILIHAAVSSLKPAELRAVWDTGANSKVGLAATFVATLFFPIQAAVGLGVVIAALLYLNRQGLDVTVVERVTLDDGLIEERTPPRHLQDHSITVLDIYGSLFYAGARTLEHELPSPDTSHEPVVVLRMRGRPTLGSTFFKVLLAYADRLADSGGRLYLSGLDGALYHQFQQTAWVGDDDPVVRAFPATPVIGESSEQAIAAAHEWLDHRS
jgi:SulP family sulfate permease